MARPIIARVYEPGTFAVSTTPGRRIEFRGGMAPIFDMRDMPHVLRRPTAMVEPVAEYLDWLPEWLRQCGEFKPPQATVRLPDGIHLGPPPDYELFRSSEAAADDSPAVADDTPEPVEGTIDERFLEELEVAVAPRRGRPRKE